MMLVAPRADAILGVAAGPLGDREHRDDRRHAEDDAQDGQPGSELMKQKALHPERQRRRQMRPMLNLSGSVAGSCWWGGKGPARARADRSRIVVVSRSRPRGWGPSRSGRLGLEHARAQTVADDEAVSHADDPLRVLGDVVASWVRHDDGSCRSR